MAQIAPSCRWYFSPFHSVTPPLDKPALRRQLRQMLRGLTPASRAAGSSAVCSALAAHPAFQQARTILTYAPRLDEVDVTPLTAAFPEKDWVFPRVDGDSLSLHRVTSPAQLIPGAFGLLEPDPDRCPRVPASQPDLIFVPALAFARDGHRLGRGAGFYDRLLSTQGLRARLLGLAFSFQVLPDLPVDPHDRPVDEVITDIPIF